MGVLKGLKYASGSLTPGQAVETVDTGLNEVVQAVAGLKGDPTIDMNSVSADIGDQAGSPAKGSINVKSWAPTAAGDTTPTAASQNFVAVDWIAFGK